MPRVAKKLDQLQVINSIHCTDCIYRILNNNEVLYVGRTNNMFSRIQNHVTGHTPATKDIFENREWTSIECKNINGIIDNINEFSYIENLYIEKYKTINHNKGITDNKSKQIKEDRKEYLKNIVNNINWVIYGINKYKFDN